MKYLVTGGAGFIVRNKIFVNAVKEPRKGLADRLKAKELLGWEPKIKIEDWIASYKKTLGL